MTVLGGFKRYTTGARHRGKDNGVDDDAADNNLYIEHHLKLLSEFSVT